MNFKKIFNTKKLKPHFKFSQTGNIWRIYFNSKNILVGETRDIKEKQSYLFSFDYKNKSIFLKDFQLNERWWFAIDSVTDEYIILSHFKNPESPNNSGFEVIDIKTGEKLWSNDDLEFYFSNGNDVYALKQMFETFKIYKLNLLNGAIVDEYRNNEDVSSIRLLKSESDIKTYERLLNTEVFDLSDDELIIRYPEIYSRIKELNLDGVVEYIQSGKFFVYNYHETKGIDLKDLNKKMILNKLEIYDLENRIFVYEDILNKETSNYVPDSFFTKDDFLIYIKEKSDIVCLELK